MSDLPDAPASEEGRDACCVRCGSLFHPTEGHDAAAPATADGPVLSPLDGDGFPLGYDFAEFDQLTGRRT